MTTRFHTPQPTAHNGSVICETSRQFILDRALDDEDFLFAAFSMNYMPVKEHIPSRYLPHERLVTPR